MSRLSREQKRELKRQRSAAVPGGRAGEPAPAVEVHVPTSAAGATVEGVPLAVPPGETVQHAVLNHLHRIASATGHPVLARVHDERIGFVVPLQVHGDGSSRYAGEPVRVGTPPPPPAPLPSSAPSSSAASSSPEPEPGVRPVPDREPDAEAARDRDGRGRGGVPDGVSEEAPDAGPAAGSDDGSADGPVAGSDDGPGGALDGASEPVADPVADPLPEPLSESASASVSEPPSGPIPEPAPSPVAEPAADPVAKPVAPVWPEPVSDDVPEPEPVPGTFPAPEPRSFPAPVSGAFPAPVAGSLPEPTVWPEAPSSPVLREVQGPVPDAPLGVAVAPTGEFGPAPEMPPVPGPLPPAPARTTPTTGVVFARNPSLAAEAMAVMEPDPESKPTPPRGFDAVAESVLTPVVETEGAGFLAEPVTRINEAVKDGRIEEAAAMAERTVAEAARSLGPDHPEVLRLGELSAYIAYLTGDVLKAFHLSLDLARSHRGRRDPEAAYGNVQSAATAWRAVRDPAQGMNLGRVLIEVWTGLVADGGPAADDLDQLESARTRMSRLAGRARARSGEDADRVR
ncbi:tetratricopeptide repeat protein [Streptomyces sp. NPDC096934]|uniref:tetratricopeptide repeat protein n=1 Tax=Streptomyces sp. NPDC096934 TaxID=3155551 RepID=UPI00332B5FE9